MINSTSKTTHSHSVNTVESFVVRSFESQRDEPVVACGVVYDIRLYCVYDIDACTASQ